RVAGRRRAALRGAAAVADLALDELRDFDLDGVPEHRLGELQLELITQIGAAEHLGAAATAGGAEDIPEHIPEDIAECIAGAEPPAARAAPGARGGLDARG